jgi:CspA family cold shock protein
MPVERLHGKVKRVIIDKGFGFIEGKDGKEYFFHRSSLGEQFDALQEHQKVSFIPTKSPKGERAEQVELEPA